MELENLLVRRNDAVAEIEINRPQKLNALNKKTIQELETVLWDLVDDKAIRVVILTGSGERAFVAGADISEFANFSVNQGEALSRDGHQRLFNRLESFPKPVIAAINGFALGGGLELAMACHIRLASETAKLGLPEVSLGVIPGYGGTQRLCSLVGRGKATEMIVSTTPVSASEALQWGLVNRVTTQDELLPAARELAKQIAKQSPRAISLALRAVQSGYAFQQTGLEAEIKAFGEAFGTADFKEGTAAFLEKRKPQFTGN